MGACDIVLRYNTVAIAPGGVIAFEVADLDRLLVELKAKDVALPATDIQSPVCRMAMCIDSEGNRIVLHQLKRKPEQTP